jgi:hypothetical protein
MHESAPQGALLILPPHTPEKIRNMSRNFIRMEISFRKMGRRGIRCQRRRGRFFAWNPEFEWPNAPSPPRHRERRENAEV